MISFVGEENVDDEFRSHWMKIYVCLEKITMTIIRVDKIYRITILFLAKIFDNNVFAAVRVEFDFFFVKKDIDRKQA